MSSVPAPRRARAIDYPTGDGKPMAETELHRNLMIELILTLQAFFLPRPRCT